MVKKLSRIEYEKRTLSDEDISSNPFDQLNRWWQDSIAANIHMIDAIHLSTVNQDGHPDARIVLLKSFDENGLVFYTNYESKKAQQLGNNNNACMLIFWPKLERQIRVRGVVEKTSLKESQAYFETRPRGAQIGAWASPQSKAIKNRMELEKNFEKMTQQFNGADVPCPTNWGGFRLTPTYFEFWQGRENRLHDRICYQLENDGHWSIKRLAP